MFARLMALIAFLLIPALPYVAQAATPCEWGVTGHPGMQMAYSDVSLETQLDLLSSLGAKWYRTDWRENRVRANPEYYDAIVDQAALRGIKILPVIFPTINCRNSTDLKQIRAEAARFGNWIAARYKGKISHWELDNEMDNLTILRQGDRTRYGLPWMWGSPNGDSPNQYEENRYQRARAELLGLYEGVKAADPAALTMINSAGWLHYGFFERLRQDRVPYDILGWHWYSEMGDMTRVKGRLNVLEIIKRYGKPVWITEINRRGGSAGQSGEKAQANYLTAVCNQLRNYPGVKAVFAYELLDEPYFGASNPESYYGLVQVSLIPGRGCIINRTKPAFDAFRQAITPPATVTPVPDPVIPKHRRRTNPHRVESPRHAGL